MSALRDGVKGVGCGILALIVAGVVLLAVALMWVFGVAWFSETTAETRGETSVREQTIADGTYRIAAYEKFYDTCAAIQAVEDQLANMEAAKGSLPKDQYTTNVLALSNKRNTLIREYNADARKEDTRAGFRSSDLPYQIDPQQETTPC